MSHKQEQLALLLARKLLQDLLDPNKLPAIPVRVREQAATVLRHFPSHVKVALLYAALKMDPPNEL